MRRWSRAGFSELIVVAGHAAAALREHVERADTGASALRFVCNRSYRRGLGTSVRAGVRYASAGKALLFGHADMPGIRVDTIRRIADVGLRLGDRIVVPRVRGRVMNPVYFPPTLRMALRRVRDTQGGRAVYRAHAESVFNLDLTPGDDLVDVDRVEDLERL